MEKEQIMQIKASDVDQLMPNLLKAVKELEQRLSAHRLAYRQYLSLSKAVNNEPIVLSKHTLTSNLEISIYPDIIKAADQTQKDRYQLQGRLIITGFLSKTQGVPLFLTRKVVAIEQDHVLASQTIAKQINEQINSILQLWYQVI